MTGSDPSSPPPTPSRPILDYARDGSRRRIPWRRISTVLFLLVLTAGGGAAGYFGQSRLYSAVAFAEVLPDEVDPALRPFEPHLTALRSEALFSRTATAVQENWDIPSAGLSHEALEVAKAKVIPAQSGSDRYIYVAYTHENEVTAEVVVGVLLRTYWKSLSESDARRLVILNQGGGSDWSSPRPLRALPAVYGAIAGLTVAVSILGFVRARKRRHMSSTS